MLSGMSHSIYAGRWVIAILFVLVLMCLGCEGQPRTSSAPSTDDLAQAAPRKIALGYPAQANASPEQPNQVPASKKVPLGRSVWFATEGNHRRILVDTTVCLREGG